MLYDARILRCFVLYLKSENVAVRSIEDQFMSATILLPCDSIVGKVPAEVMHESLPVTSAQKVQPGAQMIAHASVM